MTSTVKYKGYTGQVELDAQEMTFFGEVIGLKDVITFRGKTPEEIVASFHRSVDDYLNFCKELNQKPEKPFAGKIPFRTTPEEHYNIYMAAKLEDKSVNAWMNDVLAEAAQRTIAFAGESAAVTYATGEGAAALPASGPYYSVVLEKSEKTEVKGVEVAPTVHFLTPGSFEVHTTSNAPIQLAKTTIGDIVAEAVRRLTNGRNLSISRSELDTIVAETVQAATETKKESAPEPARETLPGSAYIIALYESPASIRRKTRSARGGAKRRDTRSRPSFG